MSSAYPTEGYIFNIGKEQTKRELCQVVGIDEKTKRRASLNLTSPQMNALEICQDILKAPTLPDLLEAYEKDKAEGFPEPTKDAA